MSRFKAGVLTCIIILGGVLLLTGCVGQGDEEELTIYSGRREHFVEPLVEEFEAETGISVNLLSGGATEYAHRIMEERNNPRADLFLANDAGIMEYLRLEGVLSENDSEMINEIPEEFRADDGSWVGLSARSRVLMYNPELISEEEMPQSILDMADPKYDDMFAITRPGNSSMVSHIAALRSKLGDQETKDFIQGMLDNNPEILQGHTDVRQAVGRGEVAFGLVNNYYYHLQLEEEEHDNVKAIYPDQGEDEMGTFVNIAGAALVDGASNKEEAKMFIDFLIEPEQQENFARVSRETPILPDVPAVDYAREIDEYDHLDIDLMELGPVWEDAIKLMEEAGYVE